MSKIKCTLNLVDRQWLIQKVSLYPADTEIEIMCRSENEITYFNGLSFGYKLISAEQTVSEKTWPEVPGIQIECADASPIKSTYFTLLPERPYRLEVFLTNNNETFEGSHEFITERTRKPWDSWVWNGSDWEAPTSCPGPGYWWDESQKGWIKLLNPLPPGSE